MMFATILFPLLYFHRNRRHAARNPSATLARRPHVHHLISRPLPSDVQRSRRATPLGASAPLPLPFRCRRCAVAARLAFDAHAKPAGGVRIAHIPDPAAVVAVAQHEKHFGLAVLQNRQRGERRSRRRRRCRWQRNRNAIAQTAVVLRYDGAVLATQMGQQLVSGGEWRTRAAGVVRTLEAHGQLLRG